MLSIMHASTACLSFLLGNRFVTNRSLSVSHAMLLSRLPFFLASSSSISKCLTTRRRKSHPYESRCRTEHQKKKNVILTRRL